MLGHTSRVIAAAIVAAALGGCGGEDEREGSPDPATERSDRAAKPPAGWRTLTNRQAGFTISVPRDWTRRTRGGATLIRSRDRLLAVTVAADRSEPGRETRPAMYARKAIRAVPGFARIAPGRPREVAGSPYESARVDARGIFKRRDQRQRITVAAFRRPERVTYAVVAFGALVRGRPPHARPLDRLLRSLRARRPAL